VVDSIVVGSRERFHFNEKGTRFKIFAHSRALGFAPETVHVDAAPGSIGPGPADAAIEVIDAPNKDSYYSDTTGALRKRPRFPYPPDGRRATKPVAPRHGHFDHLEPPAWEFSAAMVFAVIRTTLSVWSHFFEVAAIPWHFTAQAGPVLQVHPRVTCANGWSGNGFLEFGFPFFPNRRHRFCENFEVVAHETGHLIMKSMVGTMPDDEKSLQHRAHEEAAADLIALVTTLHFESVIAHVLRETAGFLFGDNLLSRFGEWGRRPTALPRRSFNEATMASVRAEGPRTKHALSAPFTGAVYDVLVGLFVRHLVVAGAIDERLAARCRHTPGVRVPDLGDDFRRAYRGHAAEFAEALRRARDELGWLLAGAWRRSTNDGLVYTKVLRHLLAADTELGTGHGALVAQAFAARGIAA
jgi:hypothetical protein